MRHRALPVYVQSFGNRPYQSGPFGQGGSATFQLDPGMGRKNLHDDLEVGLAFAGIERLELSGDRAYVERAF
ncbi:hypothetical protein D9M72_648310 [compost metagenome]